MSNVIELTEPDFKNVTYIDDDDIGVSTRCKELAVYRLNKGDFEIVYNGGSFILKRDVLAEFLQVTKVFVDSKDKFKPDLEMIGCDY